MKIETFAKVFFEEVNELGISGKILFKNYVQEDLYLLMSFTKSGFGLRTDYGMTEPNISLEDFEKIRNAIRSIDYESIVAGTTVLLVLDLKEISSLKN